MRNTVFPIFGIFMDSIQKGKRGFVKNARDIFGNRKWEDIVRELRKKLAFLKMYGILNKWYLCLSALLSCSVNCCLKLC
ncbi:MAG: hypothetical protein ACI4PL_01915, partial [Faecousia sp.]